MAIPSGLSSQCGFKTESVFGTGVTVDQFTPMLSEGLKLAQQALVYKGIIAGRRTPHGNKRGVKMIGGPLNLELYNKPTATLLEQMFGPVVDAGAGPYTHTADPDSLTGVSMTVQIGRPDSSGTVRPITYTGCKVADWEIACAADEIAKLNLNIIAQDEDIDGTPALASASYLSGIAPFIFSEGVVTIAATPVTTIASLSLKGNNNLKVDRKRLGSALINEPLENGIRDYTLDLECDFESLTHYTRFTANTEAAVVLTFTAGTDVLAITMNMRTDGDTAVVEGEQMLRQPLKLVGQHATADASTISAVLTNAETTAA